MSQKKVKVIASVFEIVGDGGISSPEIGEGRFIPTLIIDVEDHVEIQEMIKLHVDSPPGDTNISWAFPKTFFKPKGVVLYLEFIKPMEISFGIAFSFEKHYSLIDGIIQSRGVRIQTGKAGDRVSEFKSQAIIIEIPNLGFDSKWEGFLNDTLKEKYKKLQISKRDRQTLANQHIKGMREIWNIRRS